MAVVTDFTAILTYRNFGGDDLSLSSWNLHEDIGNPVFVTYSFATESTLPSRIELGNATVTYVLTDAEQTEIRKAIAHIEKQAGVTFIEVDANPMVTLLGADLFNTTAGQSDVPVTTENQRESLLWAIDRDLADPLTDLGRQTALHELMHALGIDHPFEGTNTLPGRLDTIDTTLMSYTDTGTTYTEIRPMDQEALQFLYGPKAKMKGWSFGVEGGQFKLEGAGKDDRLTGISSSNKISGEKGDDYLTGWHEADTLDGGKGNDVIVAGQGEDLLIGGGGNDLLYGDGQEIAMNGTGTNTGDADTIKGGGGNDKAWGRAGDDEISGQGGKDVLYGDAGEDTLKGDGGKDKLYGGSSDDSLEGGSGNDKLFGEDGGDTLEGGTGNDKLFGGENFDVLDGGAGKDKLEGGAGNDTLTGGADKDVFRFTSDDVGSRYWDTIMDFEVGKDRIDLPGAVPDIDEVSVYANQTHNGNTGTLVLIGGSSGYGILFAGIAEDDVRDNWGDFTF